MACKADSKDLENPISVMVNSRILCKATTTRAKPLEGLDLALIHSIEETRILRPLSIALGENVAPAVMQKLASIVGSFSSGQTRYNVESTLAALGFGSGSSFIREIHPIEDDDKAIAGTGVDYVSIYMTVDPLSLSGQRAAGLLELLRDRLRLEVTVLFHPKPDLSTFPLQNFYRFASGGNIRFNSLPRQHTLTVRIDHPEAWNVQATASIQDLDNLVCDDVSCGDGIGNNTQERDIVHVKYELKSMLISGQCYEDLYTNMPSPPNGLQLQLRRHAHIFSRSDAAVSPSDTLVMKNLGYFQLQASPGMWELTIAPGRGATLFTIADQAGGVVPSHMLAVNSFVSDSHVLPVIKIDGMENEKLLMLPSDEDAGKKGDQGMWDSFTGMISGQPKEKKIEDTVVNPEDGKIHVFSLASGHLYERLLRIMMLSVHKTSSMPVKYWLFENFLSPRFKKIASAMANKYGFEVAYVTYKWPDWLTNQSEKQRIIWGYKILFLDVLFPLNIKKVIYVDADQVVRSDLKELWDMDLEGKPYAYTPFCDSRKETLGFQFWRQGYWADHLRGKPYHISALYVVDLDVFRRFAVGDTLRATYDMLARDPNSLSNLDQDLPNYTQHSVPIFSLPQEWLWCESWCSDDSKSKVSLYIYISPPYPPFPLND